MFSPSVPGASRTRSLDVGVVGFANSTTRGTVALGIEAQWFSRACSVPLAEPRRREQADLRCRQETTSPHI
jgi:hypothetical protein